MAQVKVQNNKNLSPQILDFCKILKIHEKIFLYLQTFSVITLYCTKSRCSQIETQLKVEIVDGHKAY